nr:retrovirus-related Pol polyprotein from transposon TNT 1-94 [Tanacetum cinerariifolium]
EEREDATRIGFADCQEIVAPQIFSIVKLQSERNRAVHVKKQIENQQDKLSSVLTIVFLIEGFIKHEIGGIKFVLFDLQFQSERNRAVHAKKQIENQQDKALQIHCTGAQQFVGKHMAVSRFHTSL